MPKKPVDNKRREPEQPKPAEVLAEEELDNTQGGKNIGPISYTDFTFDVG